MFRYYLIPFETDPEKMIPNLVSQPKYIKLFGRTATALQPKIVAKEGCIPVTYRQNYYIIRLDKDLPEEYDEIESMPDVIRLDADTEVSKLAAVGVDVTGISDLSARKDKDRTVTKWLTDKETILSEVLLGVG